MPKPSNPLTTSTPSLMMPKRLFDQTTKQSQKDLGIARQSFNQQRNSALPMLISEQSNVMKSPSSPSMLSMNNVIKSDYEESPSDADNKRLTRNDSCPSPLDEHETVLMLGSG